MANATELLAIEKMLMSIIRHVNSRLTEDFPDAVAGLGEAPVRRGRVMLNRYFTAVISSWDGDAFRVESFHPLLQRLCAQWIEVGFARGHLTRLISSSANLLKHQTAKSKAPQLALVRVLTRHPDWIWKNAPLGGILIGDEPKVVSMQRTFIHRNTILLLRSGAVAHHRIRRMFLNNLYYLSDAVDPDDPAVVARYVDWMNPLLRQWKWTGNALADSLRETADFLAPRHRDIASRIYHCAGASPSN